MRTLAVVMITESNRKNKCVKKEKEKESKYLGSPEVWSVVLIFCLFYLVFKKYSNLEQTDCRLEPLFQACFFVLLFATKKV